MGVWTVTRIPATCTGGTLRKPYLSLWAGGRWGRVGRAVPLQPWGWGLLKSSWGDLQRIPVSVSTLQSEDLQQWDRRPVLKLGPSEAEHWEVLGTLGLTETAEGTGGLERRESTEMEPTPSLITPCKGQNS